MDPAVWAVFALTELTLTLTPGPAVLFVVSQGLRLRSGRALWSAGGILAVNLGFFAISATGIGALLASSLTLFTAVKWAGAVYLLYLGANALFRPPPDTVVGETPGGGGVAGGSLFLRGCIVQLSNPKALLFFVAVLPQFIDRSGSIAVQIALLGATSILLELLVLAAYGMAAARAARVAMPPRYAPILARVSGACLVGAALGLAELDR